MRRLARALDNDFDEMQDYKDGGVMTGNRVTMVFAALAVAVLLPATGEAQLNGGNIKGDAGLKAGSQPPPNVYVAVPLWFYSADAVKDREGDELLNGSLDTAIFGAGLIVVTQKVLLGGRYGFMALLPGANNRVQGAADFDANPGAGLTDMYVQPISLGWTKPGADFIAAYGLFIPTGRYEDGADNNTGLGQWGQEILAGTTVYLNQSRTVHVATTAAFEFHSKKEDSGTKVGTILTLEGGAGADFLGGGVSAGLAYYGGFKLTEDKFEQRGPALLIRGKHRVWGLGPELTLALASPSRKAVYGFVTVRYQWEIGARTTTDGAAWNVLATFPLKPIPIP